MAAGNIRVFGLTGGLGSGKSSVAAHYRARGLPVIDADVLARAVVAPGSPALSEIAAAFGDDMLQPDGTLDRSKLGRHIFAEPTARERLEQITHPRIQALRDAELAELADAGQPLACYEVPLLFEKGLESGLRPVVVIVVPEAMQLERAMRRDQASEQHVRARLAAQLPLADKTRRADYLIDNSGPLAATLEAADDVLRRVCARLGVDPTRYFSTSAQPSPVGGGSVTRG
jgi:dephospho-CoA kinase